jgi:F-BAR domain only protein
MHEPGLNSSIVESVSAWFSDGAISRAAVIGEVALAYNPPDVSAPFGTDTIRLNNFAMLDKVAPNPAFIEPVSEKPGMYTVSLRDVTKTAVAFKYQMRLDEATMTTHTPLTLKSVWKIEPTQASVLVTYGIHPNFGSSLVLSNVVLMVHLDPAAAKATNCKSMRGGIFARERSLVYWRLGELSLVKDGPAHTLKARFFTDGEAKAGNVEARWEISNEHMVELGSGLSVSVLEQAQPGESESTDPFADEEEAPSAVPKWKDVRSLRRFRSGNYVSSASQ